MIRLPGSGDSHHAHRPLSEINVTPMVDVMLVLLIIFMVATPLMVAGVRVDLPKSASAAKLEPEKPVVVNVLPDGALTVDGAPVYQSSLVRMVRGALGGVLTRPVYVAGDQTAAYGQIISVIDDLAIGGMERVVLVADRSTAQASAAPIDQTQHDHAAHLRAMTAAGQE